jgi:hypothetical protein
MSQTAKISILGVSHFEDDILVPQKQTEVQEVVHALKNYQPTKILIEASLEKQEKAKGEYEAFLQDKFELKADEIYQIAFRLAKDLKHSQLYCIDAWERYSDLPESHSVNHRLQKFDALLNDELKYSPYEDLVAFAEVNGQSHLIAQFKDTLAKYDQKYDDRVLKQLSLKDKLALLNSEEERKHNHAFYISDLLEIKQGNNYAGADFTTRWWFNRNLRIFANILGVPAEDNDRFFVLIGCGHVPILKHCIENHPRFDYVEIRDYL